jgi:hypothetical protein
MPSLKEVASYVRSKNAGPFWVTIDIFCDGPQAFERLARAPALAAPAIADLYAVSEADVKIFPDSNINVIKISFPRPVVAGSFRDRDAHAGQYFVPLLSAPVD